MTMAVLSSFWARILDFGCNEVRTVGLNVPPEILCDGRMSRCGENDYK